MDAFLSNEVEYGSSSDDMDDNHSPADISDNDGSLHYPMSHPQQEDQVEEDNDFTQTFNSALSGQCMANANQQILPIGLSRKHDPSRDAPSTSGLMTSSTDLQPPFWLPDNSALARFKLQAELELQELEQGTFQDAQPSTAIPPSQLPSTSQNSSQNQNLVCQPTEPNPERMDEREEIQALAEDVRNRRLFLGYSLPSLSRRLNKLCCEHNMERIFSATCIHQFEEQKIKFEYMLMLKPMLNVWLKVSSTEKPRRSRYLIPKASHKVLVKSFQQNSKPSSAEIYNISKELNMNINSVSKWFNNRRY